MSAEPPRTLSELLAALRESPCRVVFPGTGEVVAHAGIPALAAGFARRLRRAGVRPGDLVGLVMSPSPRWLAAFFGAVAAGAVVTVLPLPPLVLDPVPAARQLQPIVAYAKVRWIVADGVGRAVAAELAVDDPGLVVLDAGEPDPAPEPELSGPEFFVAAPEAPATVQLSSGSTSRPKGVQLTHRAILAGVSAINQHIATTPDDVLVQWTPLFHDMGLVALLCSLLTPNDAHVFAASAFLRSPKAVLAHIAEVGGSIVTGPNFSYDSYVAVAGATFAGREAERPLARWRLALNGAEPVRADTVTAFSRTFGPLGVSPSTMYPCYGMAEATLAVTLPRLGTVPRTLVVDRDHLVPSEPVRFVADGAPCARTVVGVGVPVPGMRVRICDPDTGRPLAGHRLGEIRVQGPAVTGGYLYDETTTRRLLADGWLRTGDLGFFDDDELFVVGRLKEMIVVRGRNLFPDDAELVARRAPGVYRENCVAVADPDREQMLVVAETGATGPDAERLRHDIRSRLSAALGLAAVRVELVPPRWLPRTTSGKWRRALVPELLQDHLTNGHLTNREKAS